MLTNVYYSIWVSIDLSTAFITVYGVIFINTIHFATGQLQPRINNSEVYKKGFYKAGKGKCVLPQYLFPVTTHYSSLLKKCIFIYAFQVIDSQNKH